MAPRDDRESRWKTFVPAGRWLAGYQLPWLRSDAIAGITLAAYAIPVALAYASLAGLPPEVGIYGYLLGDDFLERVVIVCSQLGDIDPAITAVGLAALALLFCGETYLPGRPVALMVVALSVAAVSFTPLGGLPLTLVGSVPAGLPHLGPPGIRPRDVDGLLPLACGCVLLAYIEGVAAARTFAARHGYPLDARQELLGLGGANLLAAFGGGYPVAGGLSQSQRCLSRSHPGQPAFLGPGAASQQRAHPRCPDIPRRGVGAVLQR
jgi:MFS superfamily sulfate permease-like transporter